MMASGRPGSEEAAEPTRVPPDPIIPSLYAADHARLHDAVAAFMALGVRHYHFDVMDGAFVPARGLDLAILPSLVRAFPQAAFDVHLMVCAPAEDARTAIASGAASVSFHPESHSEPDAVLTAIRGAGARAGVAIGPDYDPFANSNLITHADYLVAMLIEPGTRGAPCQPRLVAKLAAMRRRWPDLPIIADGGVNDRVLESILASGATSAIVGGALFEPPANVAYKALQKALGCLNAAL
ncbi:hypothetical protein [Pelagibacterium montanilacus]|uniref:hypothetical protein n=1 Tax=Pelagibacterium montanilacus TaxID=2185280 RepID=UPI000F8EA3D7|nr:hypothetical protein [Pelagibacterium montanilacus]